MAWIIKIGIQFEARVHFNTGRCHKNMESLRLYLYRCGWDKTENQCLAIHFGAQQEDSGKLRNLCGSISGISQNACFKRREGAQMQLRKLFIIDTWDWTLDSHVRKRMPRSNPPQVKQEQYFQLHGRRPIIGGL